MAEGTSSQATERRPALTSQSRGSSGAVLQIPEQGPGFRRRLSRFLSFIAQEVKRPSLLSSSSDSNESESTPRDPFGSANQDTREAARVLGVSVSSGWKVVIKDQFRRAASSTGVNTVGDEIDERGRFGACIHCGH